MLTSFKKRLETTLEGKFLVFEEEKIDYNTGHNICLIKNYNSTNYKSSILFNLQLEFYTNNIPETMSYLSSWSWEQNETSYALDDFPYVKQLVSQPINNSNFIEVHENYIGTIVLNVTLIASFNLIDIKEIYIDNELFDPNQLIITYASTPNTQRNNQEELNNTIIEESSLNIQVVFPCDNTNFAKKVRSIMFGKISKNTDFVIKFVYTDDEEFEINTKMFNKTINKQRGILTTDSVTLVH